MPTELYLKDAMPKRQQYIFLIEDCAGPEDKCDAGREHMVDAVIRRFYAEATNNIDVDFHLRRVKFSDDFTWCFGPIVALDSDIDCDLEFHAALPRHEKSVWKELSDSLHEIIRNNRASGLTMFLPVFVFFVDDCQNIENAIDGGTDLANNPYYAASKSSNRRIVFCGNNIWNTKANAQEMGVSILTDFVFPYRLFNDEVLSHFFLVQGRAYMSGELFSELLTLHERGTLHTTPPEVSDWTDECTFI